ncbi:MAG: hypothetical protein V7641_2685 [Blastocatellia bacterium]
MTPLNPDSLPAADDEPEEFYPNGIFADTGRPLPLNPKAAVSAVRQTPAESEESRLASSRAQDLVAHYGVGAEVEDANDLEQAGWGVIFHSQAAPAVKAALQPLLKRRSREARKRYKVFENSDGYQPGESAIRWLARHRVRPEIVDPDLGVPFYLMIVGSPEEIPFEFQYALDVYWAVGRLHFDEVEAYARYAQSVVDYETATSVPNARKISIFSTSHDFDTATQMFSNYVALPLANGDKLKEPLGQRLNYSLESFIGKEATKENLNRILSGLTDGGPPALLLSGSHGMVYSKDDPRLANGQGALVCQDWSGYGDITESDCYGADNLPADAKVQGLIHFFFACYSAGWPMLDDFQAPLDGQSKQISPKPLMSRLPQRLLSHAAGGALATLGHVDRAWSYSFHSARIGGQIQGFRDVMTRILRGDRVGYATDQFDIRRVAVSDRLADKLRDIARGAQVSDNQLLGLWIERNDARNYVVLGDPAVRLRVADLAVRP